jgi:peptidoglycan/xylan/chitin deacetylase (PgdA/CDA1 family)
MYLVKSPLLLKWYYPSLVWNKVRDQKVIYLTFDDGPIPDVTTFVLKTLKAFDARATFFCVGDNIVKHPDIFQNLLDDGHQVGNHTFNHLRGWATPDAEYLQNFQQCQQLTQTNLFRPPYGRIKKSQVRLIKQACPQVQIVMWDVLSGDFDTSLTPQDCFRNVIQYTENGSIVVFHDHLKAMDRLEYTLPKVLQHFREQGYTFGLL